MVANPKRIVEILNHLLNILPFKNANPNSINLAPEKILPNLKKQVTY